MKKTTIYLDVDDDIATIIGRLKSADNKIVAMVLPKRPSVLQSSVNMRLLKRATEESSKNLVLITNDTQIHRLAGEVGMHISQSLQSKPFVPDSLVEPEADEVVQDESDPAQPEVFKDDKKIDLSTPVGELTDDQTTDEIELDNTEESVEEKPTEPGAKTKKVKVPNFNTFRIKLAIGVLAIALIGAGLYWAFAIAPKATVTISTATSDKSARISVVAASNTQTVNEEQSIVPAVKREDKQRLTGTFQATGQKDVGTPAKGTVSFRNCESPSTIVIPKGTGLSRGSVTFITQEEFTLPGATLGSGLSCTSTYQGSVSVAANIPGDQYNYQSGTLLNIASTFGNVTAQTSSNFSGGTTKIAKVVSQEDVDNAKTKILATAADNVKGKLSKLLADQNLLPIEQTYSSTQGEPAPSVKIGDEASGDVTLVIEIASTMLGIKTSDLEPLVLKEIAKQIDQATQKVYDAGLKTAKVDVIERPSAESTKISIAVTSKIGPNINVDVLKKDLAGKRAGEAKQFIEARPGVNRADILLSPFWVSAIPKNTSKTTIIVNE